MLRTQRKKIAFFCIALFFFFLGFFVHATFFPYMFVDLFVENSNKPQADQTAIKEDGIHGLTTVSYTNGSFTPRVVKIKKSYYLRIVNESETELMWLTSTNPLLKTARGYGKSEEHRTILYEPGSYDVSSALHPDQILKVVVQ